MIDRELIENGEAYMRKKKEKRKKERKKERERVRERNTNLGFPFPINSEPVLMQQILSI
jgi:hypothetical protein